MAVMGGIEKGNQNIEWWDEQLTKKGTAKAVPVQKERRVIAADCSNRSRADPFCDDANPDPALE
jgi:hypothetical protein